MALSTSTTAGSYELPTIDSTYPWPRDRVGSHHGSGLALSAMPLERTQDLGRCPLRNEIDRRGLQRDSHREDRLRLPQDLISHCGTPSPTSFPSSL